jgi:membrane-bound lytic murein transglycosylase A
MTGRALPLSIFGVPDDLLVVDLGERAPELKGMRLRGRLEGRRIVPYYDRAGIESRAPLAGREIVWVDDAVDLFFLQVQGSGRIALDSGETISVGYADQNGHPYRSIGRVLVERGDLPLEQASMQGIKAWARANPGRLADLLNQNARYVFFRELPASGPAWCAGRASRHAAASHGSPPHRSGRPSTSLRRGRSPTRRSINLRSPRTPVARSAAPCADYLGLGEDAAREAGRMKQPLRMWVLLPRGFRIRDSDPALHKQRVNRGSSLVLRLRRSSRSATAGSAPPAVLAAGVNRIAARLARAASTQA